MNITRFINQNQRQILSKARETYGDTAQILVANEELCELAAVCAKFPRYSTKEKAQSSLHEKAVDEVADVLIVLDHIINIFGLTPVEIGKRIAGKVARLDRWLNASSSMEQTTVDRRIENPEQTSLFDLPCKDCSYDYLPRYMAPCFGCGPGYQNFSRKLPCERCKNKGNFKNLVPDGTCMECLRRDGALFESVEEE